LFGREFELLQYRRCWAEDRVFYRDGDGELLSLPASWTSAAADDPFVAISAGRSPFRVVDLLGMAELVARTDESSRLRQDGMMDV